MKKLDFLIVFIVLILDLIIVMFTLNTFKQNGVFRYVEVYVGKEVILSEQLTPELEKKYLIKSSEDQIKEIIEVDLDYEIPLDLKGYDLLYIYNDGIQVIDADCLDKVIVKMGFSKYSFYPLICIPRNLVIKIIDINEDFKVIL